MSDFNCLTRAAETGAVGTCGSRAALPTWASVMPSHAARTQRLFVDAAAGQDGDARAGASRPGGQALAARRASRRCRRRSGCGRFEESRGPRRSPLRDPDRIEGAMQRDGQTGCDGQHRRGSGRGRGAPSRAKPTTAPWTPRSARIARTSAAARSSSLGPVMPNPSLSRTITRSGREVAATESSGRDRAAASARRARSRGRLRAGRRRRPRLPRRRRPTGR